MDFIEIVGIIVKILRLIPSFRANKNSKITSKTTEINITIIKTIK